MIDMLRSLAATPHVADGILIFVLLEAIGLLAWHRLTKRGFSPAAVVISLLPGVCLLLALRFALSSGVPADGGAVTGILACLMLSLVAHLIDLFRQMRLTERAAASESRDR